MSQNKKTSPKMLSMNNKRMKIIVINNFWKINKKMKDSSTCWELKALIVPKNCLIKSELPKTQNSSRNSLTGSSNWVSFGLTLNILTAVWSIFTW